MHAQIARFTYKTNESIHFFFCSDLHFGHHLQNKALLKQEFDRAKELQAKIMIAGDVMDLILKGDVKRYTASGDTYHTDNNINATIEETFEFLRPYAKQILFIGTGNHEVSVSKFHNFDPIQALLFLLNKDGADVKHGQYCGFIRLAFERDSGGHRFSRVVYYNHGQGGTAEISKGIIDLNRHLTKTKSDIVWIGHKHTKLQIPSEAVLYMTDKCEIREQKRAGIITGSYLKNYDQYDAMKSGYKINFAEERMRGLQGTGGIFLEYKMVADNVIQRFSSDTMV